MEISQALATIGRQSQRRKSLLDIRFKDQLGFAHHAGSDIAEDQTKREGVKKFALCLIFCVGWKQQPAEYSTMDQRV